MFQQIRAERGERGFTLVELLVVIAILGILAGVAVFSLSSVGDNGAASACMTEKSTVTTGAAVYQTIKGTAVSATSDLTGTFTAGTPAVTYGPILASTPKYWKYTTGALSGISLPAGCS
jgi:prepilin-type N-terminal cleavage/methylation domain-containing protein